MRLGGLSNYKLYTDMVLNRKSYILILIIL